MTEIDDKYAAMGGAASFLGNPLIAETPTPGNTGRFRHYQGGSIYWSAATGAHSIHDPIRDRWAQLQWERGFLGFPLIDVTPTPNGLGYYTHFQGGSIYFTPSHGAHELHGPVLNKWASLDWERSVLGFPVTGVRPCADGIGQFADFEWGSIYRTPAIGAKEVHGFIRARWTDLNRELGVLGYPISDEYDFVIDDHNDHDHHHDDAHPPTRVSDFEHGSIYWDKFRGPYEVLTPPPPFVGQPAVHGEWEVAPFTSNVVGVHAALLRTNKVLFFTYLDPGPGAPEEPQDHGDSAVLDLATGTTTKPAPPAGNRNLFCAGQAFLPDGRLLIAGGERLTPGLMSLHIFDTVGPNGGTWQYIRDMPVGRWYPTPVTLPDGRIFILGGANLTATQTTVNTTYEIFDPAGGPQPPQNVGLLQEVGGFTTFPFVYVLPNKKLFMHAGTRTRFIDLQTMAQNPSAIEAVARPGRNARTYNLEGTSVLLPLQPSSNPPYRARVMVIGGGGETGGNMREAATNTCEALDVDAPAPAWQLTAPMLRPRVMPDAVLLPDGKVLVMNGSSTGFADNGANPVFETEIYDPVANTWTQLAGMTVPRLYHSTALLLPDGRVLTAGSDSMWNPGPFHVNQLRVELFSPPYLFAGPRPEQSGTPTQVTWGQDFDVSSPQAASIDAVSMMRCGSATHSFNSDQRMVGITIKSRNGNDLTLQAPPDGFVAPPGFYMLFLLQNGVPSTARFIRLGN